ncbi:hypothetical protein D3C72_2009010 [compost metagenome]
MGKHEPEDLRQRAVDDLEVLLEGQVVGQIELADAGGIAGAAEILEQQGVVEIMQRLVGKAEFAADRRADPAAADAMTGRLALGHVERHAQRLDDFRKSDPCRHGRPCGGTL